MAPEANRFNSFLRILEMQFHRKKKTKTNKKATRACLKVCRKTHLKYFDHDREAIRRLSHSPIDNTACLSDIKNINHK